MKTKVYLLILSTSIAACSSPPDCTNGEVMQQVKGQIDSKYSNTAPLGFPVDRERLDWQPPTYSFQNAKKNSSEKNTSNCELELLAASPDITFASANPIDISLRSESEKHGVIVTDGLVKATIQYKAELAEDGKTLKTTVDNINDYLLFWLGFINTQEYDRNVKPIKSAASYLLDSMMRVMAYDAVGELSLEVATKVFIEKGEINGLMRQKSSPFKEVFVKEAPEDDPNGYVIGGPLVTASTISVFKKGADCLVMGAPSKYIPKKCKMISQPPF